MKSEKQTTIFRVQKNPDNPYVMMDKRPIENNKLSWKAKGLLSYMLSRPDDWNFNMSHLIKQSIDGEAATRTAMKELIEAGYVILTKERNDSKQFTTFIYNVYEKPLRGNPQVENPQVENRHVNNNDCSDNDFNNISDNAISKSEIADQRTKDASIQEIEFQDELPGHVDASRKCIIPDIEIPDYEREGCDDDGIPDSWKPAKPKKKSSKDVRTDHPAIVAYHTITGKYPKKSQYDTIIQVIGERPNIDKMKFLWNEWDNERGYYAGSIKWITEWYKTGIPKNGFKQPVDALDEILGRK